MILVGGSTRSPVVRDYVAELFGREPLCRPRSRSRSSRWAPRSRPTSSPAARGEVLLLDVIPLSLGIETMGGVVEKLIPRNTTIPTARGPDVHDLRRQPDRLRHPRGPGRARAGRRLPLARALHAAGHPADAGRAWRGSRSRFEVDADGLLQVIAQGADAPASRRRSRSSRATASPTRRSSACCSTRSSTPRTIWPGAASRSRAGRGRAHPRRDPRSALEQRRRAAATTSRAAIDAAMRRARGASPRATDHRAIRRAVEALDHASQAVRRRPA